MASGTHTKIGIAALIMTGSVFASRFIGLVREMVIAHQAGASGAVDAYQVAFILPDILNHVVASGFLSITFIPIFSDYLARNAEAEGWEVLNTILSVFGSLLVFLIAIAEWFTPQLVRMLAPGLTDPTLFAEAVDMTRIILPAQFFFFSGGLFMAVQFAKQHFAIPAMAPLLYNLGIICGGIWLGPLLGIRGFAWGVLAGALVGNFGLQYIGARRLGMRVQPRMNLRHPDLKKYIRLTLPLMIGLTMTFSAEIFLKLFGSLLPRGSIAALNYALRVMLMLVAVFGQAVGVASFPFLARLAAEKRLGELNRLLNATMRYLALVIPFSAVMMVLRREIVLLLFQRGRFDATATDLTAMVLVPLLLGAFAFAVQTIVARGFYAQQNTLLPAVFGTVAVIVSLPVYWLGTRMWGGQGLALAIALSATLQVGLLFGLWNRRMANSDAGQVYGFILKTALLSLPLGLILEGTRIWVGTFIDATRFGGALAITLIIGIVFIALLLLAGMVFNISEIRQLRRRLQEKATFYLTKS